MEGDGLLREHNKEQNKKILLSRNELKLSFCINLGDNGNCRCDVCEKIDNLFCNDSIEVNKKEFTRQQLRELFCDNKLQDFYNTICCCNGCTIIENLFEKKEIKNE